MPLFIMFCRKFFVPLLLPGEISLSFKCTTRMSFPMCISLTPSRKSRKMCSALALQSHHRHRAVLAKHLKTNKQTNTHTHNRTQSSKSRVLVGNGCQFLQCKFSHMAAVKPSMWHFLDAELGRVVVTEAARVFRAWRWGAPSWSLW